MSRAAGAASQLSSATQYVAKSADNFKLSAQAQSAAADRFVQDLERQVAVLGKTRAEILSLQAAQLGVSDRVAPLINRLNEGSSSMSKMGASAAQTAAAMRMVPAQMTDIIVSLQGGQAPMTVLLQQGGQLKDMFGGIGPAAKALGGYVMGMVNPFTVAAAAAAALYMAYRAGAAEAEAFNRTLITTGNAVGLTTGQLQEMSKRLADIVGTQSSASAALNEFAKSGRIGAESMVEFAAAAARWEDATGTAVEETVKQFAELGKDPLAASIKLNESMNYLTASVYEQIKALVDQGRQTEAAKLAQEAFANSLDTRTPGMLENLGLLQKMWREVKKEVQETASLLAGIGRETSPQERLAEVQAEYDQIKDSFFHQERAKGLLAQITGLQDLIKWQNAAAQSEKDRQEQVKAAIAVDSYTGDRSRMSRADQMKKDIAEEKLAYEEAVKNARGNKEQLEKIERAHQESLKTIRERYKEKGGSRGGISATDTETANLRGRIEAEKALAAQLAATGGMVSKLNEGERLSLQYSEKLKLATDAKTKARLAGLKAGADELGALQRSNSAIQEMAKIREREIDAQIKETESITSKAIALEDEIAVYGLGKAAIEAMVIARLESKRAALIEMGASEDLIDALNREIAERQRLAKAMGRKDVLDANSKAAEEAARAWERVTDQVGQSLSDAIFDGGKSGKELVEDLFRTMILRPVLQPVVQAGMNMVGQALNIPGAPGVQGTSFDFGSLLGGGNISGSISNFADVAGIKLYNAGMEKVGSALVENSAAIGKFANGASQVFGYGKAIYDVTQGAYGSAIGTAIGTYILPGIGTMIGSTLGGLVDGMFGQPEARYGGTYTFRPGEGTMRPGWAAGDPGPQAMQFADSLLRNASDAVQRAFAAAGSDALLTAFEASFESSEKGRGGTHSGGTIVIDGHEISFGTSRKGEGHGGRNGTLEEMMQAAEVDTWQTVIQAWQAAIDEFPSMMQDMIRGVDADALGLEAAQALAQQFVAMIEQVNALSAAIGSLPFAPAVAQTFEFAAALAEATGGAENAANQLASYYQNYYTEAERAAHLTDQLTARFADLGYMLPQTREEFRALVEVNLALGEAGARTVAELLSMESALSSLLPAFDAITGTIDDVAAQANAAFDAQLAKVKSLADETNRLLGVRNRAGSALDQIDRALGRTGQFGLQREAELWAAMATASYEQQIDLASELTSITLDRYQEEIAAAERLADLGANLRDYVQGLKISDMSPLTLGQRLAEAGSQYAEMLARAQAGDTDAMAGLQGMADSYLRLARDYYASSDQYTQIFDSVTGGLDALGVQAQSDAERQLAIGTDSLAELEQLHSVAQNAYAALDRQYQQSVGALERETALLADLGQDTGRLHDIASLLGSLPAELAARLQPFLDTATRGTVTDWYQEAGRGQGDAAGVDYWQGQLGTKPQDQVKDSFTWGLIADWYRDDLGRNAAEKEIAYWAEYAKQYGTQTAYQAFLAGAQNELGRIPGFANGGLASGLAWVGERGPELVDFASPGRVYSNEQLSAAMFDSSRYRSGNSESVLAAGLRAVQQELVQSRKENAELQKMLAQVIAASAQANANDVTRGVANAVSKSGWANQQKAEAGYK